MQQAQLDEQAATRHVVIVGGGITGMSAAYALQQAGVRYTLVEREGRLGGKIRSEHVEAGGGYVVEAGPDSILTQKPWGLDLARSVGLADRMIGTNQKRKTVYILSRGRPEPMPEGLMLVVPLKLWPFMRSRLLSLRGRLRAGLDLVLPRRRETGDEAMGAFIRRRMGQEVLERMAEPLMSGIHNAECERQSIQATFPRFPAIERKHGSLIRGLLAERRAGNVARVGTSKPATTPFVSFPGGLQELVDALSTQLTGRVITGTGVQGIERDVVSNGYRVTLANGETLDAEAVIVSTPAYTAAELLKHVAPKLTEKLRQIRYVSTATVSLAFGKGDVGEPIDGSGLLVPRVEGRQINAITMSSIKYAHRAPDDAVLMRVFVGGSHNPAILKLDDQALLTTVRSELRSILGINAEPLFTRVYRWNDANPQYDVGHLDRVAELEQECPDGLLLAGCAYRGVGIPDCINQGQEIARQALAVIRRETQGTAAVR